MVVGQEVVDQERGREQRTQQGLLRLAVGLIERVGAATLVVVVDAAQLAPMRCSVQEAGSPGSGRIQVNAIGDREVAVVALTHRDALAARL